MPVRYTRPQDPDDGRLLAEEESTEGKGSDVAGHGIRFNMPDPTADEEGKDAEVEGHGVRY